MSDLAKVKPWLINKKENDNQYLEYIVPNTVSNNSLGKFPVLYEKEFIFDLKGDKVVALRREVARWDKMLQEEGYYKLKASAYDGIEYKKDEYCSALIILNDESDCFRVKAVGNGSLVDSMYNTAVMTEMDFHILEEVNSINVRFPLSFKDISATYDKNKTIVKQNVMAFITEYGSLDRALVPNFMLANKALSIYDPKDKTEYDRVLTDNLNAATYQKNVQIVLNQLINGKYLEVAHRNRVQLGRNSYPYVPQKYQYVEEHWSDKQKEKAVQQNILLYLKYKCAVSGKEIVTVDKNELIDGPLEKYHMHCVGKDPFMSSESRVFLSMMIERMCKKKLFIENKQGKDTIKTFTFNARAMIKSKDNNGIER